MSPLANLYALKRLIPSLIHIRNVIRYSIWNPIWRSSSFKVPCYSRSLTTNTLRLSNEMGDICKEDLKNRLTPLQYHVTQEKGTERPFTGKYNKTTDAGVYSCVVCGEVLFSSDTKYDSGCGWPAFNDVLDKGLVKLSKDTSNVSGEPAGICAHLV